MGSTAKVQPTLTQLESFRADMVLLTTYVSSVSCQYEGPSTIANRFPKDRDYEIQIVATATHLDTIQEIETYLIANDPDIIIKPVLDSATPKITLLFKVCESGTLAGILAAVTALGA